MPITTIPCKRENGSISIEGGKNLSFNIVPLPKETSFHQDEILKKIKKDVSSSAGDSSKHDVTSGNISEDDIRKSLIVEAKRRKFMTTKQISKMAFEEITRIFCYHYLLESFTETRSIAEAIEPCSEVIEARRKSQGTLQALRNVTSEMLITENPNSVIPGLGQNPWDFDIIPDEDFIRQTKILEMPNSHRFIPCTLCKSEGLSHCFHCRGFGTEKCTNCRATGMRAGIAHPALYTHPVIGMLPNSESRTNVATAVPLIRPAVLGASRDKPYAAGTPVHFMAKAGLPPPGIGPHDLCQLCRGRGMRDCMHCKGQGKKTCSSCGGKGEVRAYTKLKVAFDVECSDYYTSCEIPEILLHSANGLLNFSETQSYVHPIKKHPVSEINEISKKLCAAHLKKMVDSCRVLKQRHCVEVIEMAKVRFKLGSKTGLFYVYGDQRLCYIPDNSSKCSIM